MAPFFSVVMAVHNTLDYLPETFKSLLLQTYSDFELIVVDDHSTDGTLEWLKQCADPRLKLMESPFKGQTPALNIGLRAAAADWIVRMDGDDWCAPQRLERQKAAIDHAPRLPVLITSDYWICDERLIPVGEMRLAPPNPKLTRYLKTRNNPICHPTVVFHRETALALGGYDESLKNAQDIRLWHGLLEHGDWVHVSEPLLKYRVLKGSLSVRYQPEQRKERAAVMDGVARGTVSAPRQEATREQALAIYHYKLGFAAWISGKRFCAWKHLFACLRQCAGYTFKSLACLVLSVLPRPLYLSLAGYQGVYR
jgi:glycosyltransferase involved in cell wall biosynthesis